MPRKWGLINYVQSSKKNLSAGLTHENNLNNQIPFILLPTLHNVKVTDFFSQTNLGPNSSSAHLITKSILKSYVTSPCLIFFNFMPSKEIFKT